MGKNKPGTVGVVNQVFYGWFDIPESQVKSRLPPEEGVLGGTDTHFKTVTSARHNSTISLNCSNKKETREKSKLRLISHLHSWPICVLSVCVSILGFRKLQKCWEPTPTNPMSERLLVRGFPNNLHMAS